MDRSNSFGPDWLSTVVSRRRFVEGLSAGSALAALGYWPDPGRAATVGAPTELRGTEFELTVAEHAVNLTGEPGVATLINGSLPAPILRWRQGDTVTLRVRNALPEATSIHWHGIVLPANMDGVPGLSFRGIAPGETFEYRIPVQQSGTYWYHSHSGFQEQVGHYGALIVDPREPEPFAYDREHVILLSDWPDLAPRKIYSLLRKQSDYFNWNRPTVEMLAQRAREIGFRAAFAERAAFLRMRMDPSDRADVSGYGYTYLLNGMPPAANWTGLFAPGERVRLRFINGSSMSYFDVRIPGLTMTVVAADGQTVHPVDVDEFRIGVAEVIDVIVEPSDRDAYTIFAQSMDRTGYARGTLATGSGLFADVPAVDPVVYLTMADMGHDAHDAGTVDTAAMSHDMPMSGAMDHSQHAGSPMAGGGGSMVRHPDSESDNPAIGMQTMLPSARLGDPGVGLRDNGRRVLTYADLRTLGPDPDGREPTRTIELHLTGHMGRYMWSFDGVRFSDADPIRLRYGERLRLVLVNDTMMEHPIHLHGMWSDLEDERGEFQVRKHTISVPPGTRRSYRVTADALGRWAFHCHLLYHMEAGMFREVRVEPDGGAA
jgi:CopA family copper-resistance protein